MVNCSCAALNVEASQLDDLLVTRCTAGCSGLGRLLDVQTGGREDADGHRHRQRRWRHPRHPSGELTWTQPSGRCFLNGKKKTFTHCVPQQQKTWKKLLLSFLVMLQRRWHPHQPGVGATFWCCLCLSFWTFRRSVCPKWRFKFILR